MKDQEEMRAAAFTALLDWHPGFATMAPEVWEPLVDRMCDAWRARKGGGTFHLFAKEWIAAECDQLAPYMTLEITNPNTGEVTVTDVSSGRPVCRNTMPTSIDNSSDRHAVWKSVRRAMTRRRRTR